MAECICCGFVIDLGSDRYLARDEGVYDEDCAAAGCAEINLGDENTICRVNCQCGCSYCYSEGEHEPDSCLRHCTDIPTV